MKHVELHPREAMGLAFSVPKNVRPPRSLNYIFAELESDLGIPRPPCGDLTAWAERGVLLLNAALTVGQEHSHRDRGWEFFTDRVVEFVHQKRNRAVFCFWGKVAQRKAPLIEDRSLLTAPHPSRNGLSGCRHFSKANERLVARGVEPIDWSVLAFRRRSL